MFTDVVGSTGVRTTLGDDAGDAVVARHDAVVRAAVQDNEGSVVKGTGDGCLAMFSSARGAVAAAIDIQRELSDQATIGINTGEVLDRNGDVFGESVNAAARIAARASPGEILVSRVVRDLLGTVPEIELTTHGTVELKGFPEPWDLFAVNAPRPDGDSVDEGHVSIQLLGGAALALPGKAPVSPGGPRLQELLTRLVLARGAPVARMALAFQLWPDSTESQARTNLRKVIHELKSVLPSPDAFLDIDSQAIRWRPDAPGTVDVWEFLDAVDDGDLDRAVEVYGGPLLPACYSEWLLAERERLEGLVLTSLRALALTAEQEGDDESVLDRCRTIIRLDPLDEEAHRATMRTYYRTGQRAQALRAFHRCAEALRRSLGVEPDEATMELYDAVRAGSGPRATSRPTGIEPPVRSQALVGREAEWAVATGEWERASEQGTVRLMLVSGEAGIGKSRLAADLARHVTSQGHVVARSRAFEAAGRFPWAPVVEWLRSDALAPAVKRLDDASFVELARLLPELADQRTGLAAPVPMVNDTRRQRLFEVVAAVLTGVGRPLLLVLDDLQWCDGDTIELVGVLARTRSSSPVLVVATARSEEMANLDALRSTLDGLARDGSLTQIPLERLTSGATHELVERLVGEPVDDAVRERVWRETEGNPLFVVEAVRSGLGEGSVLTPTVQAAIRSRLALLSNEARSVLDVAGTIGRSFSIEELAASMGCEADDLIDPLDELWRRQVIREQGADYDFTHDKLREVAQAEISPVRRRRTHRAVADGLVALYGQRPGPLSARLAAHYEAAGLVDAAISAYRDAAQHAVDVFSYRDSIELGRRALRLLEDTPRHLDRGEMEVALRIGLATSLAVSDGYNAVHTREAYDRALAVSRRLGRADPAALRGLGLAELVSSRFHRSTEFGEALLQQVDDPVAITEGHYLVGVSSFWLGRLSRSDEELTAALASYRPEQTVEHLLRFAQDPKGVCLVRLALTRLWRGQVDDARSLADEAKAHSAALGHPVTQLYVMLYGALVQWGLGEYDKVRDGMEQARAVMGSEELDYFALLERLTSAGLDARGGDADAIDRLRRTIGPIHDGDLGVSLGLGLLFLAESLRTAGRWQEAVDVVLQGLTCVEEFDQRYAEPQLRVIHAELLDALGDSAAAAVALDEAQAVVDAHDARLMQFRIDALRDALSAPA